MGRDEPEVLALRHVLAALEHHVLEEVGEAALPALLVARADVVHDRDRDRGRGVVDVDDDAQPVGERRAPEVEVELDRRLGHGRRRAVRGRTRGGLRLRGRASLPFLLLCLPLAFCAPFALWWAAGGGAAEAWPAESARSTPRPKARARPSARHVERGGAVTRGGIARPRRDAEDDDGTTTSGVILDPLAPHGRALLGRSAWEASGRRSRWPSGSG